MSSNFYRASAKDFQKIPGSPVAYWVSEQLCNMIAISPRLDTLATTRKGMVTARNDTYVRLWFEPEMKSNGLDKYTSRPASKNSKKKWFAYTKGGEFRKWYGNTMHVVNWQNDGNKLQTTKHPRENRIWATNFNLDFIFKPSVSWSDITSSYFSARRSLGGTIFDATGLSCFSDSYAEESIISFLNSKIATSILTAVNPTLHFQAGNIASLPLIETIEHSKIQIAVTSLINISKKDWDNYETSWDFADSPLLRPDTCQLDNDITGSWKGNTLETSWNNWKHYCDSAIARMQELEIENNQLWIDAYGLQDELTPEVPEKEITLARADAAKDMATFLSYAVGCMMGRFSLDAEGLIMANSGETIEDYVKIIAEKKKDAEENSAFTIHNSTFAPDDDGIIPVLDDEWFDDDIVGRTKEFLRVTFGDDTLKENIDFIEQSLGKSLRKYFVTDFYKNHISGERAYGYKKRPIYWLVQSPKKSFQALIYLHRYTKDTMNLVLNNYLREFEAKLENRLDHLAHIITSESSSGPDKTKAQKETDKIKASLTELDAWEKDILFPIASQRIELDLDDGVKANYPKLGKTLAKIPGVSQ